jgi:hypothetical protein
MNFEDELRSAMRREDPPASFAARVVARAQSAPARSVSIFQPFRMPRIAVGALAAMLSVGFFVQMEYRRARAERAEREATIALRIAAEKLNMVRAKLVRYERQPGEMRNE